MFDCTELKTFLNSVPITYTFCLYGYLNPFFTDRHVINRDGVFCELHDLGHLTENPPHSPSALYFV